MRHFGLICLQIPRVGNKHEQLRERNKIHGKCGLIFTNTVITSMTVIQILKNATLCFEVYYYGSTKTSDVCRRIAQVTWVCHLWRWVLTPSEVSLRAQLECQRQIHVISPTVIPEYCCRDYFILALTVTCDQAVTLLTHLVMSLWIADATIR